MKIVRVHRDQHASIEAARLADAVRLLEKVTPSIGSPDPALLHGSEPERDGNELVSPPERPEKARGDRTRS